MMRLRERDIDSDMPHLIDPREIQPGGQEADSEITEFPNPCDLRELVISHTVLAENGSRPNYLKRRHQLGKSTTAQSSSSTNSKMETIDASRYRTGSGDSNFTPDSRSADDASAEEGGSAGQPAGLDGNRSPNDTTIDEEDWGEKIGELPVIR